MKVLFISYDGLTDPLGQSQIIPYLIGLQKAGHSYSVVSFEKKQAFESGKKQVSDLLTSAGIHWHPVRYTKWPPVLSTVKDVFAMSRKIKQLIRDEAIEVLHCRSYISMFAAFPVAQRSGIKLIFDMRGFWIDERVEGHLWKLNNPVYRTLYFYLKKKEKKWMRKSDAIVSLTEVGRDYILNHFNPPKNTFIQVIPCCADETHFDPEKISEGDRNALKSDLGIMQSDIVLGYSGSIGTWYLAEEMMQQFRLLKEAGTVNKFLWITKEDSAIIFALANKLGVSKEDIIVCSSDRHSMPLYLSMMDLGIFYIKPSFSKKASSPTKLGELLLMGIPVVCNSQVGDLSDFFDANNVGICHNIELLNQLSFERNKFESRDRIREIGMDNFSLTKGIELYEKVLNTLK